MLAYISFCCDSFRNVLLAHWHKEKKEVLANHWQMKRWQLARGIVQGQSDLLDGYLQNKSYVDDILKKK